MESGPPAPVGSVHADAAQVEEALAVAASSAVVQHAVLAALVFPGATAALQRRRRLVVEMGRRGGDPV